MTDDIPYNYDPAKTGCQVCGTQDCETLDGVNGRLCREHPPRWERRQAAKLADAGLVDVAVAYKRTFRAAS